ncbi:MAG: Circadian clock protein KaiC [Rhizobacter sp.]|nr:Circadian clock protein KaiC [Rhizobacter sp.]
MQSASTPVLHRLPSGITGLDTVLGGGFFRSGVYIVHGLPGCGKTILANQICYAHVKGGGKAVYVTLLAESHSRMLQHISGFDFFDESALPDRLSYLSAYNDLEQDGLKGLMNLLRREMRAKNVDLLVLDGMVMASEAAQSDRELKKFIHELQTSAVFHGCTVFLLTSGGPQRISAEHTMVDGLIELEDTLFDVRAERSLQVRKFRGAGPMRGKHSMRITDAGIDLFPRIEAMYDAPPSATDGRPARPSGIPSLDALMSTSGFPDSTATVVIGSTGTGKTTFGLHYVSLATADEPAVFFTFCESPTFLREKAAAFGIDLRRMESDGALELACNAQSERSLDEVAHDLLARIERIGAKRLVIDGLAGFFEATTFPQRMGRFFGCLCNELRRRGVTFVMTLETRDAIGSAVPTPHGVSSLADNLVFLRFTEHRGRIKRLLSLIKIRDAHFDASLREVTLDSNGMSIAGTFSAGGDVIPTAQPVDAEAPTRQQPASAGKG